MKFFLTAPFINGDNGSEQIASTSPEEKIHRIYISPKTFNCESVLNSIQNN